MIKKIDHIAIAVSDLDTEIARYRDVFGMEFHGTETVEEQKVKVAFFSVGDVHIELTSPTEEDSPVGKFISKRAAPGILEPARVNQRFVWLRSCLRIPGAD